MGLPAVYYDGCCSSSVFVKCNGMTLYRRPWEIQHGHIDLVIVVKVPYDIICGHNQLDSDGHMVVFVEDVLVIKVVHNLRDYYVPHHS